jgi:hypothetical protein
MDDLAEGEVGPSHNPTCRRRWTSSPGWSPSPLADFARHTAMDQVHRSGTMPSRVLHARMTVAARMTAFLDTTFAPQILNGPEVDDRIRHLYDLAADWCWDAAIGGDPNGNLSDRLYYASVEILDAAERDGVSPLFPIAIIVFEKERRKLGEEY